MNHTHTHSPTYLLVSSTPAAKMAAAGSELFANLERLKWKVYAVAGVALGINSLYHIFPSILMPV